MSRSSILIVDDNAITRKMVRITLTSEGYGVVEAEDGRSTMAVMREQRPDLVLLDLVLPDVDGFDLLSQLRALPEVSRTPIIAYSGFLSKIEEARRRQLDFTDYLLKPVGPQHLIQTIQSYLSIAGEARGRPAFKRRILVAHDDPIQRKLLKLQLEGLGYAVTAATDGGDALEQARRSQPDAIVSDVLMPGLDGFQLCWAVRQDPELAHLPVVLITCEYVEAADRRLAEGVGASAFLPRGSGPNVQDIDEALRASVGSSSSARPARSWEPIADLYAQRVVRQLEQQIERRRGLERKLVAREAELAILGGLAESLQRTARSDLVLTDILQSYLDAAGISQGAVFLIDSDRRLTLRAQMGYSATGLRMLEEFARADLSYELLGRGEPIVAHGGADPADPLDHFLHKASIRSAVLTPLVAGDQSIGMLLTGSMTIEFDQDWVDFTTAVAHQLSQALALARAVVRLQESEDALRELNADLEGRIAERTAELTTANRELEAFSYSISHDLRAPLRAIDGFSSILVAEHASELSPEAARYLQMIQENAHWMGQLVDDLLKFARLSRQPLGMRVVVPAETARQALTDLQQDFPGRQITITDGASRPCRADPTLLRQIYVNLLSNALKFTRGREMPAIEVGGEANGGEFLYFVRDNGVGFDMRYASKLFGVFQRLHRAEEYHGTGVGLAIVQRIVQRHGGRVWAEAEPDRGATFYFSLPGATRDLPKA